jgi:hypothetical protein
LARPLVMSRRDVPARGLFRPAVSPGVFEVPDALDVAIARNGSLARLDSARKSRRWHAWHSNRLSNFQLVATHRGAVPPKRRRPQVLARCI